MRQEYDKYTEEDFEVWKVLFERQAENLQTKACSEYLDCLQEMSAILNAERIPRFEELDAALMGATGWSIEVVPGLIPEREFFPLLAQRRFCSSTWLRTKAQLDYLEEPDMFHDIFGHIPLLMDQDYADFMQAIGELGMRHTNSDEAILQLKRLYWFTIEFGLIRKKGQLQIYGAGIISSFGESNHIFENKVDIDPFDMIKVLRQAFINSEIQTQYFEVKSFQQIYNSMDRLMSSLEKVAAEDKLKQVRPSSGR